MKNLLVSVIIPIYNAANYIENMVTCLKKQTYSFLEYIFIDDGSSDGSLEILKTSTASLKNCYIYSYENGGAAVARNRGLEKSNGDIICFLDCDDEISDDYVEKLVEPFKLNEQIDVSICGYQKIFLNKTDNIFAISRKRRVINYKKAIKYIFSKHHTNMIVPWAKAVRSDIFSIRFPVVRCEDEALSYQLFLKCNKIALIPECLYKYIERDNSDSKNDNFSKIVDIVNIYYNRYETLKKNNVCKNRAFYEFAYAYFGYFHRVGENEKRILLMDNNSRIKAVSHCWLSFRFIKFLMLLARYKMDMRVLKK